MTSDEIIRMAREAGFEWEPEDEGLFLKYAERFAALVAAAEREECAKVCDSLNEDWDHLYVESCAAAIRARGGK